MNSFLTMVQVVTEHGRDHKLPAPPLYLPLSFQPIHESPGAQVPEYHILWEKLIFELTNRFNNNFHIEQGTIL
jgi:hypothetical protein